jgi:hypothetical protein
MSITIPTRLLSIRGLGTMKSTCMLLDLDLARLFVRNFT